MRGNDVLTEPFEDERDGATPQGPGQGCGALIFIHPCIVRGGKVGHDQNFKYLILIESIERLVLFLGSPSI